MNKTAEEEFTFIRDKLERIARLLVDGSPGCITEAAFMVGCLHTVCIQNATLFKSECKADLHDR